METSAQVVFSVVGCQNAGVINIGVPDELSLMNSVRMTLCFQTEKTKVWL